ncbi:hypothetical protein BC831DRAFT_404227 [Entophlyctis helioformis]|nr:hypothetical protein BC831DRAFT_404227 [Entophlyctis helioformis]
MPPAAATGKGVAIDQGVLVVREMKDDNSCLFRSIGYVLERNPETASKLRKVVSDAILSDPFNYSAAILGRDPLEYTKWIQQPNSWGGAIELAIFSAHYAVGRSCRCTCLLAGLDADAGEGAFDKRVFLMYSGIHYDAIALTPADGAPEDFDQTTFSGHEAETASQAALKLAEMWRKQRKFTDLANFTLRCAVCKQGLTGQKEAQAHAKSTGHASFTEYQ